MTSTTRWIPALEGAAIIVALLTSRLAFAQDVTTAEFLFLEGKRLMEAKQYAQACPKLAESYRADPATGALLALALCHENEGKLASAWTEYQEVVSRAQKESSPERARAAFDRASKLGVRVSVLAVNVREESAKVPGLEVKRDGVVLGQAAWGIPVPSDGGEHVVEASAPGRKPWIQKVTLGVEKDNKVVEVPVLEETATGGAAPPPPLIVEPPKPLAELVPKEEPHLARGQQSPLPTVGWAGVGIGAGVVGLGGVLALTAKSSYDDATQHCGSNIGAPSDTLCDPGYTAQRNSAVSRGSTATWLVAGGAALAVTGVVLIIAAPRDKTETPRAALNVVPGGLLLNGEF